MLSVACIGMTPYTSPHKATQVGLLLFLPHRFILHVNFALVQHKISKLLIIKHERITLHYTVNKSLEKSNTRMCTRRIHRSSRPILSYCQVYLPAEQRRWRISSESCNLCNGKNTDLQSSMTSSVSTARCLNEYHIFNHHVVNDKNV